MSDSRLPGEPLGPLALQADRLLAHHGYAIAATIDAVDEAIPGIGGLFDPNTEDAARRAAIERLLGTDPPVRTPEPVEGDRLVLYVDGSSRGNPGPAGAGAVVIDGALTPPGETHIPRGLATLAELGRPVGANSNNNVAEYAALQLGLEGLLERYAVDTLEVRIDSMTVVRPVWTDGAAHPGCDGYVRAIRALLDRIPEHSWTHLADAEPNPADAIATVGADIASLGP